MLRFCLIAAGVSNVPEWENQGPLGLHLASSVAGSRDLRVLQERDFRPAAAA